MGASEKDSEPPAGLEEPEWLSDLRLMHRRQTKGGRQHHARGREGGGRWSLAVELESEIPLLSALRARAIFERECSHEIPQEEHRGNFSESGRSGRERGVGKGMGLRNGVPRRSRSDRFHVWIPVSPFPCLGAIPLNPRGNV